MFGESKLLTDYINTATTVFTPIEYGCIGYSEEEAKKKFGENNLKIYESKFRPLEWVYSNSHDDDYGLSKLVCLKESDKVIGFHYLGPHAGEVTQGYAVAFKAGVKKEDFDLTIGIHPTTSENFTTMYSERKGEVTLTSC